MIIYQDTEKEMDFCDYKRLPDNLKTEAIDSLEELKDNLYNALENGYIYHSELLCIALQMDINKVEMYLKFAYRKAGKKA